MKNTATIKTAIALYDGVTSPLKNITTAMNIVLNSFEAMQNASKKAIDTAALKAAREELAKAETAFDAIEKSIRDADNAQKKFNSDLQKGSSHAGTMLDKIKNFAAAYVGFQGVGKIFDFVKSTLSEVDSDNRTNTQLKTVLRNTGADSGVFDRLLLKADSIENTGIYDAGSMLAGAAEIATYINDPAAIESMMGTLANYAVGMTGGGTLDESQMTDLATQLGKALNGTYDGLAKKGFTLTDAQKEIIENGTDMQKAMVLDDIVNESWGNLYQTMSSTPEGKIIQLQNRLKALMQTAGEQLYPAVAGIINAVSSNWGKIENIINGFTRGVKNILTIMQPILTAAINIANAFVQNWSWISPIVYGAAGAVLAYKFAVEGATVAEDALKAAKVLACPIAAALSGATTAQTAAQWGLNEAIYACPIFWIFGIIIALIAGVYIVVGLMNKLNGTAISATGVIVGAYNVVGAFFKNLLADVWNVFSEVFTGVGNAFYDLANYVIEIFDDPSEAFKTLLKRFYDHAIDVCLASEKAFRYLNKLWYGDTDEEVDAKLATLKAEREELDKFFAEKEQTQVFKRFNLEEWKVERLDYEDEYNKGYKQGEEFVKKIFGTFGDDDTKDPPNADDLKNEIQDLIDSINNNTEALNISSEDLKYLRDVAEREAINRFTTAEIRIEQHNENHIASDMDIDGIMDAFADGFAERLDISAEGVHS